MYILSIKSLIFNCEVTFTLNIFSQDYYFRNAFCENGTVFPHLDESYFSINHPLSNVEREEDAHHLCFQGKEHLWYTYQGGAVSTFGLWLSAERTSGWRADQELRVQSSSLAGLVRRRACAKQETNAKEHAFFFSNSFKVIFSYEERPPK